MKTKMKELYAKYKAFNASKAGKIFNGVFTAIMLVLLVLSKTGTLDRWEREWNKSKNGDVDFSTLHGYFGISSESSKEYSDEDVKKTALDLYPNLKEAPDIFMEAVITFSRLNDKDFKEYADEALEIGMFNEEDVEISRKFRKAIQAKMPGLAGSITLKEVLEDDSLATYGKISDEKILESIIEFAKIVNPDFEKFTNEEAKLMVGAVRITDEDFEDFMEELRNQGFKDEAKMLINLRVYVSGKFPDITGTMSTEDFMSIVGEMELASYLQEVNDKIEKEADKAVKELEKEMKEIIGETPLTKEEKFKRSMEESKRYTDNAKIANEALIEFVSTYKKYQFSYEEKEMLFYGLLLSDSQYSEAYTVLVAKYSHIPQSLTLAVYDIRNKYKRKIENLEQEHILKSFLTISARLDEKFYKKALEEKIQVEESDLKEKHSQELNKVNDENQELLRQLEEAKRQNELLAQQLNQQPVVEEPALDSEEKATPEFVCTDKDIVNEELYNTFANNNSFCGLSSKEKKAAIVSLKVSNKNLSEFMRELIGEDLISLESVIIIEILREEFSMYKDGNTITQFSVQEAVKAVSSVN